MADPRKRSHDEESIEKSAITEEEQKKQRDRNARKLEIMVEEAGMALEGNRQLLEKRQAERRLWKSKDENLASYLDARKNNPKTFKLGTVSAKNGSSSKEMDPATREN